MTPSLALVPDTGCPSSIAHTATATTNAQGLHDTLEHGPQTIADQTAPRHPLEGRLAQWQETQDNLKFTLQRQLYGLHMPVRQMMERNIVAGNPHLPARGAISNLHMDILTGNDDVLDTKDLFLQEERQLPLDIHREMERKLRM